VRHIDKRQYDGSLRYCTVDYDIIAVQTEPALAKPEAKSLGQVAREAFFTCFDEGERTDRDNWQHAADAVVKAYRDSQEDSRQPGPERGSDVTAPLEQPVSDSRYNEMRIRDLQSLLKSEATARLELQTRVAWLERELFLARGKARGQR